MPVLIYSTPEYVMQTRANSCWYACLKMFKSWHAGSRHIANAPNIKGLKSHFHPQSYMALSRNELVSMVPGYSRSDTLGANMTQQQLFDFLRDNGPFMGGGKVGVFGMGHAIFVFGVTSTHIIYHDPAPGYGRNCRMKIDKYAQKADGEVIYVPGAGDPARVDANRQR